jgi:anti-sigma B factor antagonist
VASDHLTIQSSVEGTQALVRLSGELDIDGAPEVSSRLSDLATKALDTVVLDVSGLTFLDSSGLRAILSARNELQSTGATLVLEGVTGTVERVLDATGLRELLTGGA